MIDPPESHWPLHAFIDLNYRFIDIIPYYPDTLAAVTSRPIKGCVVRLLVDSMSQ